MGKALTSTNEPYNESQVADNPGTKFAAESQFDFELCPRSVDEVYSMGIRLQYFIGGLYLEMADFQQGSFKKFYKEQVVKQLANKKEIQSLADNNLNCLLAYFYENGGPIIEPPVSEQIAREIQPFFNRIAANAMKRVNSIRVEAEYNGEDIVRVIDSTLADMYTAMSKLFNKDKEVSKAFINLAEINGR